MMCPGAAAPPPRRELKSAVSGVGASRATRSGSSISTAADARLRTRAAWSLPRPRASPGLAEIIERGAFVMVERIREQCHLSVSSHSVRERAAPRASFAQQRLGFLVASSFIRAYVVVGCTEGRFIFSAIEPRVGVYVLLHLRPFKPSEI